MINSPIDNIVLLLSSDWFFRYWQFIDLEVEENVRISLQAECRKIVSEMMGSASQLLNISYTDKRQNETVRLLQEAFKKFKADTNSINRIDKILFGPLSRHEDVQSAWFLESLTEEIVTGEYDSDASTLSPELITKVSARWLATEINQPDFEALNLASNSKWDIYVRSLTPDQPSMLSDFLSSGLLRPWRFLRFWKSLDFTDTERANLRSWYKSSANKITTEDFELPAWICGSKGSE